MKSKVVARIQGVQPVSELRVGKMIQAIDNNELGAVIEVRGNHAIVESLDIPGKRYAFVKRNGRWHQLA